MVAKVKGEEVTVQPWLDLVVEAVTDIRFGSITVVYQDGKAIQLEKQEKIRLDQPPVAKSTATSQEKTAFRSRFLAAAAGLRYGQMVLQIKGGKVTQLDRTDKLRFAEMEGAFGDGI